MEVSRERAHPEQRCGGRRVSVSFSDLELFTLQTATLWSFLSPSTLTFPFPPCVPSFKNCFLDFSRRLLVLCECRGVQKQLGTHKCSINICPKNVQKNESLSLLPPPLPSSLFSLALRNQLKGLRNRRVTQKSRFSSKTSQQPQWKVPNLWPLGVLLQNIRSCVPEVLLSAAEEVCSSSHLFPLSWPVAAGEIVKGAAAVAKASQRRGTTKAVVLGEL